MTFLTILFFGIFVISIGLLFTAIAYDSPFGAFVSTIAAGSIVHFLIGFNLYEFAVQNQVALYIILALYFPIGVIWSLFKWYLYLTKVKEEHLDKKKRYSQDRVYLVKPEASDNKGRIIAWISYWPISIIWTLIADFVTGVARRIYNKISGLFDKISDKVFKGVS